MKAAITTLSRPINLLSSFDLHYTTTETTSRPTHSRHPLSWRGPRFEYALQIFLPFCLKIEALGEFVLVLSECLRSRWVSSSSNVGNVQHTQGGTVVQWFALSTHSNYSGCSGFIPQSKKMYEYDNMWLNSLEHHHWKLYFVMICR